MRVWSATKIDIANYCLFRHWLRYIEKESEANLSAFLKGKLLHDLAENFWDRLGMPEEIKRDKKGKVISKKKYSNANEFTKFMHGQYWKRVFQSENSDDPILWTYEKERRDLVRKLRNITRPMFSALLNEEEPIFSELEFDVVLAGIRFKGRIDYGRKRNGSLVIGDFKSGRPWLDSSKVDFDPQLTLYNAAVYQKIKDSLQFAQKLGFSKEEWEIMRLDPKHINPNFVLELYMFESLAIHEAFGEPAFSHDYFEDLKDYERVQQDWKKIRSKIKNAPPVIYSSTREENHFFELLKMIEGVEEAENTGQIYAERGRKCAPCPMKLPCEKKLKDAGYDLYTDKKEQLFFGFAIPLYARQPKTQGAFNFSIEDTRKPILTPKQEAKIIKQTQSRLRLRRDLKGHRERMRKVD